MQMLRRQVLVAHDNTQRGMTKDLVERDYMAAAQNEVGGKNIAQDVACLTAWRLDRGLVQDDAEHAFSVGERPVLRTVSPYRIDQQPRCRHREPILSGIKT